MTTEQNAAHKRLWEHAQRGTGQSAVVRQFLLCLFDGESYKFDLCEFRWIDNGIFLDCIAVLELEHGNFQQEIHKRLGFAADQFLKGLGE